MDSDKREKLMAQLEELKGKSKAVRDLINGVYREAKIAIGKIPEDKKLAKKLEGFKAQAADIKAQREALEAEIKALGPGKKVTKYEYPEGLTDKQKKQYRVQQRANAKKAKKAEDGEEAPKKASKKAKVEAPAPIEEAPKKAVKKVIGKKAASKNED